MFRYTSFLASIAGAQNSSDVKDAISAAALPAGSYSLKRKAEIDLSVNSYVGVSGGGDFIYDQKTAFIVGVAAPIGVSYTWQCNQQPMSIHLNLFDFGIPLSYSFRDSSGLPANIQFKNLLALGGGFLWHCKDSPISTGILATYTPDIRDMKGLSDKQSSWRVMLLVAVDIPIFDIYSKSE